MLYLIQVTIYTAVLYAVYYILLKDHATHNWNRFYLLLCTVLPLLIPFITIPALQHTIIAPVSLLHVLLPEATIFSVRNAVNFNFGSVAIACYMLISLALSVRLAIRYLVFRRFIGRNMPQKKDGVKILLNTHAGPGSFLQYIFLPGDEVDGQTYAHELAHIRLRHSADVIFMKLLQICFWPNIMLYAIDRELRIIHEFQADASAVSDKDSYITTLLNDTFGTGRFALSHTFFYHPLKRRIMMLQKQPAGRKSLRSAMLGTSAFVCIILSGIVYLQSCRPKTDNTPGFMEVPKTVYDTISKFHVIGHREVYMLADKMPVPPFDMSEYLGKHIHYPEDARKNGIHGRAIVRFIVNENGKITDVSVVNKIDPSLAAEALKVVSAMPDWQPGEQGGKKVAVYFTQPISFQLK